MNVVGATYTAGTVISWELERARGVIRSEGESAVDVLADGTIARIYAGYGIELRSPQ